MAKQKRRKDIKGRATAPAVPSAAEQLKAARREMRQYRELRRTMTAIRRKRLDNEAAGVMLARVLCAGTEYTVIGELELRDLGQFKSEAVDEIARLRRALDEKARQLNPETV